MTKNLGAAATVSEVMTPAVVSAHPDAVFKEIVAAMSRNHVSVVPVVDTDHHVLGVVSASDLLARLSGDRGEIPRGHRLTTSAEQRHKALADTAQRLMTCPAITVTSSATVREAAVRAARYHVRCMPVVDEQGVVVGMVSRSDLLKPYLRPDEDIRAQVDDVIARRMLLDPACVTVSVAEGVATLRGFVERRSEADQLRSLVVDLPGVIAIEDHVAFRADDLVSPTPFPHQLLATTRRPS
jgi:CBS-domain-containing membrane protein